MNIVGKNIKKRRIALGLTQEDLAKKLGYKSKSTINKIEKGIVRNCKSSTHHPSLPNGLGRREERVIKQGKTLAKDIQSIK